MDFLGTARRKMLAGQLNDARERLLASFEGLTDEQLAEPGVCGEWSTAETLSHVASCDRAATAAFQEILEGHYPEFLDLDEEGIEAFNSQQHEAAKGRAPQEAVNELLAAREEMVDLLREVDNVALFAPPPGETSPDLSIASCLTVQASHDEEHAQMIEEWRKANRL